MTNMIVDMIRIPTDKDGYPLYDMDEIRIMFEKYQEFFPDHQVFAMLDKIKVWENLDIDSLKSMRQFLDEIITSKEIEENDL